MPLDAAPPADTSTAPPAAVDPALAATLPPPALAPVKAADSSLIRSARRLLWPPGPPSTPPGQQRPTPGSTPGSPTLLLSSDSSQDGSRASSTSTSPQIQSTERFVGSSRGINTYRNGITGETRTAPAPPRAAFEGPALESIVDDARRIVRDEQQAAEASGHTPSDLLTWVASNINRAGDGSTLVLAPSEFALLGSDPRSAAACVSAIREQYGHWAALETIVVAFATHTNSASIRDGSTNHFIVVHIALDSGTERVQALTVHDHYCMDRDPLSGLSTAQRYPAQPTARDLVKLRALASIVEGDKARTRIAEVPLVYAPGSSNMQTLSTCAYVAAAHVLVLAEPPAKHSRLDNLARLIGVPIASAAEAREIMSNFAKSAAAEILQRIEADRAGPAAAAATPTPARAAAATSYSSSTRGDTGRGGRGRGGLRGSRGRGAAMGVGPQERGRRVTRSISRSSAHSSE